MEIKVKNKTYNLAYTFNSFRYMEDFDLSSLSEAESKPFLIAGILSDLFCGALNNNRKKVFTHEQSDEILEAYLEEDGVNISTLIESLMGMLQNTSFFKVNQ